MKTSQVIKDMDMLPGEIGVVSGGRVQRFVPGPAIIIGGGAMSDEDLVEMYFGAAEKRVRGGGIVVPKTKFAVASKSIIQYMHGLKI